MLDKKIIFKPKFTITNNINNALVHIERVRGFLQAVTLSEEWLHDMQNRALVLEAHHTTHIEGTQLTLDQSEKILAGEKILNVNVEDKQELLNYKDAFALVSEYLDNQLLTSIIPRKKTSIMTTDRCVGVIQMR